LNYDGLYGINNINRFLQSSNPKPAVEWGINVYKTGDPVLFNESERFSPLIYNNMKGRIRNIEVEEDKIWFAVELDIAITEWEAEGYDFTLLGDSEEGNSIIGFWFGGVLKNLPTRSMEIFAGIILILLGIKAII
jgi:hypothetical protein